MEIIQSWKESLALLRPENLKPFSLVTAKTVLDVYKSLNKPFTSKGNWIIAGVVIVLIGLTNILRNFGLVFIEGLILNTIFHTLFFMFVVGMRPSVVIKDEDYFKDQIKNKWYLLVLTILLGISPAYYVPFLIIYYPLFLIFALDSVSTMPALLVSLKNSAKMLLYNLPLFLIAYAIVGVLNFILYFLVAFALGYFGGLTFATILYIIFIPIEVALIMNLYIKLLHSQPSLYFNQPE